MFCVSTYVEESLSSKEALSYWYELDHVLMWLVLYQQTLLLYGPSVKQMCTILHIS